MMKEVEEKEKGVRGEKMAEEEEGEEEGKEEGVGRWVGTKRGLALLAEALPSRANCACSQL